MTPAAPFADHLADLLKSGPGEPFVTFYDFDTGERTELSRTTYANWVAKTSSFLAEECDLERGGRLQIDLPTHWLGPVFLGACWTVGLTVVTESPDAVVTGPDRLEHWSGQASTIPVVACALKPMGGRFDEPVAPAVRDFGVEIWTQPDAFVPWDPPNADEAAVESESQANLFDRASSRGLLHAGSRLLTTSNPVGAGMLGFAEAVVRLGSLVLVAPANAGQTDPERLAATYATERADVSDQPIGSD